MRTTIQDTIHGVTGNVATFLRFWILNLPMSCGSCLFPCLVDLASSHVLWILPLPMSCGSCLFPCLVDVVSALLHGSCLVRTSRWSLSRSKERWLIDAVEEVSRSW